MSEGLLVLVATPIGNLGDLSPRAVDALSDADVIVCEDTRHTRKLLTHAGVSGKRLIAMHDQNEGSQVGRIIEILQNGNRIALVTDAGMPGISDPGELLVTYAAAAGIRVEVVPGPSAVVSALVVSGLSTRRFVFEGFLPRKGKDRTDRLQAVASEGRTVVLYESPHRIPETLDDLCRVCSSERKVALVRELTKIHEEVWRGTLLQATKLFEAKPPRGEYVIVLEGADPPADATEEDIRALLSQRVEEGMSKKDAVAEVAKELNAAKRRVYELSKDLPAGS